MRLFILIFVLILPFQVLAGSIIDCNKSRGNEVFVLACNIYQEARSESVVGQWAVALVTKNRVESDLFPNTYKEVVWQRRGRTPQFSWTLDGKSDKVYNKQAWHIALRIAELLINPEIQVNDFTEGAMWYHADYVNPSWAKKFKKLFIIGKHVFYITKE